tara:strand:+ start:1801 stop:3045 length:1245 start_codon:yes stop_codon:yes gene_type:complete
MSNPQKIHNSELALRASIQVIDVDYSKIRASKKQKIIFGSHKRKLHRIRLLKNAITIFKLYRTPLRVMRILNLLRKRRNLLLGGNNVYKVVSVANKHFWRINIPAWESPFFDTFLKSELHRLEPHNYSIHRLTLTYLAITKKCPLKCEHCFEWDNLNKKEKISTENIDTMIENIQSIGSTNIAFTGGEPMLRVNEIIRAINKYKGNSAFWILTSGFNFTSKSAQALKVAGLTGIVVSIDHHDPYQHDVFRMTEGSFRDALTAVKLGIENDLVTVISTCVTQAKATREYLDEFMRFSKDLGVGFIQFLEPKPVGHYAMKNVILKPEQIQVLEEVFLSYNQEAEYLDFPIIVYHGFYQRRVGCMASGNRMVYVDTNGDFMKCPFCHNKKGSLLDENFESIINEMNIESCIDFGNFG